jgi:ADP-heptose:LPS heptosyltransferase
MKFAASETHRIAIFRALMLGDLLNATPALRAIRAAYPAAKISYIGLPASAELLERMSSIDEFIAFPGVPGLPESTPDTAALPAFVDAMRQRRFDLVLQMHGSGTIVNPLVESLGARHVCGFVPTREAARDVFIAWPAHGHEIERLLALTDALGLPRRGTHLDFPLRDADRARVCARFAALEPHDYVVVHPGAQLPSRRWPVDRFAAVARALERRGLRVVLTGSRAEAALSRAVAASCEAALDLAGRTSLWDLGALIERAALLVSNDTGVSHIAAALGTPSVVVSSGADVQRWAPLATGLHRVLWAQAPCRPCAHRDCPTAHECATAIDVRSVVDAVDRSLEALHA